MASDQPEKPETPTDQSRTDSGANLRERLRQTDSKGRPMSVYAVIGAAVFALVVLLLVVYITANQRDNPDQPICTTTDTASVSSAIRDGQVETLTLTYDSQAENATDSFWGPVQGRVDYVDGKCTNLPQGLSSQSEIYSIIGLINFYNQITENKQIEIKYDGLDNLDSSLYVTPTPLVTPTAVPPETPPVTPTESPTPPASPVAAPATPVT